MINPKLFVIDLPEEETLDINQQLQKLAEKYFNAPSTALTVATFQSDVWCIVRKLYAEGGYICDVDDEPIRNLDDVQVIVNGEEHSLSASVVPSQEWKRKKLEAQIATHPMMGAWREPLPQVMSGLDDFPKALNGWQSKLYDLGYPGSYEAGAMMRRLPSKIRDDRQYSYYYLRIDNYEDRWFANYWDENTRCGLRPDCGASPEEAVANLMIAHPELWRK